MTRIPIVLVALVLGLALAGCGGDDKACSSGTTDGSATSVAPPTGDMTTRTDTGSGTTTGPAATGTTPYQIWFTKEGKLEPTWIKGEKTLGVLTEAMKLLLAGPPSGSDLETVIPEGTEVRDLGFTNGIATLDLSEEFAEGGADRIRVGQILYTLTQFATVKGVRLTVGGKPVPGAPPNPQKPNLTYELILPAIVVTTPTGLDPVKSPLEVAGNADVFEANVTIKILNEDGDELASTFTTATCGTGCRGTFSKRVSFDADSGDKITLVVADDDADGDGKPAHEVKIPLVVG